MNFKNFMHVHGGGLIRFEIVGGGDSGEEGWITECEEDIMSTLRQQQENLHLLSLQNWSLGLEGKVARGGTDVVFSDDRTNTLSTPGVTGRRSRNIRTWATSRRNQLSSHNFHSTHDEDEEDLQ